MTNIATHDYQALEVVDMFPGVVRRLLASGDRLTLVEVRIEAGSHGRRSERRRGWSAARSSEDGATQLLGEVSERGEPDGGDTASARS